MLSSIVNLGLRAHESMRRTGIETLRRRPANHSPGRPGERHVFHREWGTFIKMGAKKTLSILVCN